MSRLLRLILVLALGTPQVSAAAPQLDYPVVDWLPVPGCPSQREVIGRIEGYLGQALNVQREQSIRLRAEVTRNSANEYEVVLLTEGSSGTGQRHITHADCNKLAEATALVMAIAIDPKRVESHAEAEGRMRANEPSPSRNTERTAPSVPEKPSPLTMVAERQATTGALRVFGIVTRAEPSSTGRFSLSGVALAGRGLLPEVDLGAMATVGMNPSSGLQLRAGAGAYLPMSASIPNSSSRMTLSASFIDVGACAHPFGEGRWQSRVCAGAQLGLMGAYGRGNDVTNLHGESSPFTTLLAEVGYRYRFGRNFGISSSFSGGIVALRPKFGIRRNGEPEEIHRPDWRAFALAIGLFWDPI